MKILVVDDQPSARRMLSALLEKKEVEAHVCASADEALALWHQNHPAIVISDWNMPDCDGLELCQQIRAAGFASYTYFILVTAWANRKLYLQAMEAGVDDFLTKPFDAEVMVSRIRVAERILNLKEEVGKLRGMLSACCYCKSLHGENEEWQSMEDFLTKRTGSTFSHGICPQCYERYVRPQLEGLPHLKN